MATSPDADRRPPLWRRTPADAADWFDPAEVERSRAYKKPLKKVGLITSVVGAVYLLVVIWTEAVPKLLRELGIDSWPLQLVVGVAVIVIGGALLDLPASAWVALSYDKKWELSTQTTRTFVLDQIKDLLVTVVMLSIIFIPVYAVIRHTHAWWLLATGLLMAVSILMAFVYPVVIMPIFNKFTPLGDEDLKHRIDAVAEKAGVTIKGSFTMDASKRSRRDNAFVAGFGPTKRVVIYDTMLEHPAVTVEQVVAHEIGHYRLQHILTSLPAALLSTLATFGLMNLLLSWDALLDFAGVDALRDAGSLPLFMAVFAGLQMVTSLPTAVLSRHHEREADLESLRLLRNPGAMVDVWRRMAPKNIADLEPSWWKRLNASHPDAAERMAFATEWGRLNDVEVIAPPADSPPVKPREPEPASA
jgi:STE24 endopeptidase